MKPLLKGPGNFVKFETTKNEVIWLVGWLIKVSSNYKEVWFSCKISLFTLRFQVLQKVKILYLLPIIVKSDPFGMKFYLVILLEG